MEDHQGEKKSQNLQKKLKNLKLVEDNPLMKRCDIAEILVLL